MSNRTNRNKTNHGTGNLTNGSAAPPPTATVAVWDVENEPRAARSRLLIFIGISSRKGAGTLRNIQRKTWLQWASEYNELGETLLEEMALEECLRCFGIEWEAGEEAPRQHP